MKRTKPLRARPKPSEKRDRSEEFASFRLPPPRFVLRRDDGKARASVSVPKPEAAKPGKRPPTIEEKRWMDAITELGCIACFLDGFPYTPGAVHHLLRGGRRIGHLHTICLCDPGHHQGGQPVGKISRHPWKARFEERYGSEEQLLAMTRAAVGNWGGYAAARGGLLAPAT